MELSLLLSEFSGVPYILLILQFLPIPWFYQGFPGQSMQRFCSCGIWILPPCLSTSMFFLIFSCPAFDLCVCPVLLQNQHLIRVWYRPSLLILFRLGLLLVSISVIVAAVGESRVLFVSSVSFLPDGADAQFFLFLREFRVFVKSKLCFNCKDGFGFQRYSFWEPSSP